MAGAIAGGIKTSDASTVLTLVDNRSGVQIAAAEGSARNIDFSLLGGIFGGVGIGAGGYSNTPEGKVIVAAFTDSMNKLIRALRNYKAQNVAGGLGKGGALRVQGSNSGLIEQYEGVMVSRVYNLAKKVYEYTIITKDRTQKFTFTSPRRIPYKDDLVRFNVIAGEVDPSSIRLLERRYYQTKILAIMVKGSAFCLPLKSEIFQLLYQTKNILYTFIINFSNTLEKQKTRHMYKLYKLLTFKKNFFIILLTN